MPTSAWALNLFDFCISARKTTSQCIPDRIPSDIKWNRRSSSRSVRRAWCSQASRSQSSSHWRRNRTKQNNFEPTLDSCILSLQSQQPCFCHQYRSWNFWLYSARQVHDLKIKEHLKALKLFLELFMHFSHKNIDVVQQFHTLVQQFHTPVQQFYTLVQQIH